MAQPEPNQSTGHDFILKLPIKVSGTVIAIALSLDITYGLLSGSAPQTLAFATATAAAAGAILAAFYTGKALRLQIDATNASIQSAAKIRELERKRLAHQIAARWNDPSMRTARRTCREIVDASSKGHDGINDLIKSGSRTDHVIHLLNFLEEVAIAEDSNIADQAMLKDFYAELVHQVWKTLEQWIKYYRASRGTPAIWDALEALHKKWAHASHPKRESTVL